MSFPLVTTLSPQLSFFPGHIAIDELVFPSTTTGYILDAFARRALWQDGLGWSSFVSLFPLADSRHPRLPTRNRPRCRLVPQRTFLPSPLISPLPLTVPRDSQVHEGPHGIGTRVAYNDVKLKAGFTISNEPGYYADGAFGIRIENVVVVKPVQTRNDFGAVGWLGFERFTMVSSPLLPF